MVVVSNTSPISNLVIIGEISLLQTIYPKVLIPPSVHQELVRLPALQLTIASLLSAGWLEIQQPTNHQLLHSLSQSLDPGEAEAIALAVDINADRLLIDERLGRKIAARYGSNSGVFWGFSLQLSSKDLFQVLNQFSIG